MTVLCYGWVRGILRSALPKGDASLAAYRITTALTKISDEFGFEVGELNIEKSLVENLFPMMRQDLRDATLAIKESGPESSLRSFMPRKSATSAPRKKKPLRKINAAP
jgi:hypothetical protein